jgi:hypothetical protein
MVQGENMDTQIDVLLSDIESLLEDRAVLLRLLERIVECTDGEYIRQKNGGMFLMPPAMAQAVREAHMHMHMHMRSIDGK